MTTEAEVVLSCLDCDSKMSVAAEKLELDAEIVCSRCGSEFFQIVD